jgi:hypothetical protein
MNFIGEDFDSIVRFHLANPLLSVSRGTEDPLVNSTNASRQIQLLGRDFNRSAR